MANDLFVERQWKALLQKLRSFPLDWRNDEVNARRLHALGKEVRLSDLYAACPSLRKRVASHGGLGRLWVASHQWAVDSEAAEVQLPRATQNIDMSQETMWLQLVADMRKFPLSWNAHLHKDLRGALLGRQLHLAQRFARSPGLRRRLDQDCTWTGTACAEKAMQPADKDESSGVSCGSHRAADCSQCPQGHGDGWCHGDCLWLHEACVLATLEHRAAAEKEHQKLQSIPRLRSFQRLGWLDGDPEWWRL